MNPFYGRVNILAGREGAGRDRRDAHIARTGCLENIPWYWYKKQNSNPKSKEKNIRKRKKKKHSRNTGTQGGAKALPYNTVPCLCVI